MNLSSIDLHSLWQRVKKKISYLCTSVLNVGVQKLNLSGHFFFLMLVEIFSTYFSTRDKCRDIFDEFFRRSVERVKKLVKNVETFVECLEK